MTDHEIMMGLMQRALDDGLDNAAQGMLDAHLSMCASCAQDWEGLQALHRRLLAMPSVSAAAGFTARLLVQIAAESQPAHVRSMPSLTLIGAAGILGVVTLALLLAPLAGLIGFDAWAGILSDSLAMFSIAAAWLTLLMTFVRVILESTAEGLLITAIGAGFVLTLIWIRLVVGTDFFRRQTYVNGGF